MTLMMGVLTAVAGWIVYFTNKLIRSKSFYSFVATVGLAYFFNSVFIPLSFIFVVVSYVTGAIFLLWIFTTLLPD